MSKLPVNWIQTTISELGQVVSGGTPSTKEPSYWNGPIHWISPSDLTGHQEKFISQGAKSITEDGLRNSSAKLMPAGSVHFSTRAPIGYVVISSRELATNQGFKSLVPAKGVFNEFIYYYLKSAKQLAESLATGTTFKELSGKAFGKMPVPLPPTNEQKRIVAKIEELFSELDAGVAALKQAREKLKLYRQAVLKAAFEGRLTEAWREAHAGELESADELLERIKQEREAHYQQQLAEWRQQVADWEADGGKASGKKKPKKPRKPKELPPLSEEELAELPQLPEGWAITRFGSVARIRNGYAFKSSTFKKVRTSKSDVPLIRQSQLGRKRVDLSQAVYLDQSFIKDFPEYIVSKGDVLIGLSGSIGKLSIYDEDFPALQNQRTGLVEQYGAKHLSNKYFWFFLTTIEKELLSKGKGVGVQNVSGKDIESIAFALPSLREQHQIVQEIETRFSAVEQLEKAIDEGLKKAEALRQSILKRAFEGRLVPQDPNDEPASVLLERIQAERANVCHKRRKRQGDRMGGV